MTNYGVVDPEKFDAAQERDAKPLDVPDLVCPKCGTIPGAGPESGLGQIKPGQWNWTYVVIHKPCGSEIVIGATDRYARLRVQVAEALAGGPVDQDEVPPYGSDSPEGWACTGPLLEQFDIGVNPSYGGNIPEFPWVCCGGLRDNREGSGPAGWGHSPCEAIARCVVALAAAGKLPK